MWQALWLALDLILIGLTLLGVGLLVYILLFAEVSRLRHQRALTFELLYIYLFGYAAITILVYWLLYLLDPAQAGVIPIPPGLLPGVHLVQMLCVVTGPIVAVTGLMVLLRHRASAHAR